MVEKKTVEKKAKVKKERSKDEILESLRIAEMEEGRKGLVDKFLKEGK